MGKEPSSTNTTEGQKSLAVILNEIELRYARSLADPYDPSLCENSITDVPALVKALRRAVEFMEYAQRVFPKHYQNWDTACFEELAAILADTGSGSSVPNGNESHLVAPGNPKTHSFRSAIDTARKAGQTNSSTSSA